MFVVLTYILSYVDQNLNFIEMTIVNVHEAKSQLSALIQRVLNGEKVIIVENNIPVVSLNKISDHPKERAGFGSLKDKIWISDDCWDEDEEMIDIMSNRPIFPNENPD